MNDVIQFPRIFKSLSAFILCYLFTLPMQAQFCLGTEVRAAEDAPNEVLVDITTEEFTNIISIQSSIRYDASIYEFVRLEQSDLLGELNYHAKIGNLSSSLRFVWMDPTVSTGATLLPEQTFATFRFRKLNTIEGTFEISNTPSFVTEIINSSFEELNVFSCNSGEVSVVSAIGRLLLDENENCTVEREEIDNSSNLNWIDWTIRNTYNGEVYYNSGLFENGNFSLQLFSGINELEVIPPSPYYTTCNTFFMIDTETLNLDNIVEVLVQIEEFCPLLTVNIFSLLQGSCGYAPMLLSYQNNGTIAAENAYIEVDFDERLKFTTSNEYTLIDENTMRLDIGTVLSGEKEDLFLEMELDCDLSEEAILCTEAKIFPNELCGEVSTAWSGASLKVGGQCIGEEIIFEIENIGDGDMTSPQEYIVIEDAVIFRSVPIQLPKGEKETIRLAATGATYLLRVNQEQGHPGSRHSTASVEGCGQEEQGNFTTGFVHFFPYDNIASFVDTECLQMDVWGARTAMRTFPTGSGAEHLIETQDYLEYQIFFDPSVENTIILDTLSDMLDPLSFEPQAGSQDYWYQISEDGILQFTIPPTPPALYRNSFVKFKIKPKDNLAIGSQIFNSATIYQIIDFPVITNETFHTIGEGFLRTTSNEAIFAQNSLVEIHPNPATDNVWFTLKENQLTAYHLSIYDVAGTLVRQATFEERMYELKRRELGNGLYLYKLIGADGKLDTGTFVLN